MAENDQGRVGIHDRRVKAAAQILRTHLTDGAPNCKRVDTVGDLTVEDLAQRVLYAADKTVDIPDVRHAWDAYARAHFALDDTEPTELELAGIRAAIGAAFWQ